MDLFTIAQNAEGLTNDEIAVQLEKSLEGLELKNVLIIPPDFTRYHSNAGFITSDTPWFYVNKNYKEINVAQQENDPDSILHFYRKAIHLRKELPVVRHGQYREHFLCGMHRELPFVVWQGLSGYISPLLKAVEVSCDGALVDTQLTRQLLL